MIRPARAGDAGAMAAIYAPHVAGSHVSFEEEPPPPAELARRLAEGAASGHPWLSAEGPGGEVLGYAYAAPFRPRPAYRRTAETTIYLAEGARGIGLGRRLYAALLGELTTRGFAQAVASIALPNRASVALHERLGFAHRGTVEAVGWKAGRWVDVGYWQRAVGGR